MQRHSVCVCVCVSIRGRPEKLHQYGLCAKIRYTTNGDEPNAGSAEYIDGVSLGLGQEGEEAAYTVKAVGIMAPLMGNSKVSVSESLVIQPRVAAPVIKPEIAGPWENQVGPGETNGPGPTDPKADPNKSDWPKLGWKGSTNKTAWAEVGSEQVPKQTGPIVLGKGPKWARPGKSYCFF